MPKRGLRPALPAFCACPRGGRLATLLHLFWQEGHGLKLFIGLDVSLAKTAACVLDEHGRIVREAEVASDPEALAKFAKEQPGEIAVIGLEAGPLSQWLHRGLVDAGLDAVLMETR